MNPAPAPADGYTRALGRTGHLAGPGDRAAEPCWLTEVRLRASRRVLWLRHLWSQPGADGEQLLAISHGEVDRALMPPAGMAEAEQAFYRSDERAAAVSAQITALAERPGDARLGHLAGTFGLSRADAALFTLAVAAAADPAIARVFGYLLDLTTEADPTPALAAALFELGVEPPPGPGSALVRWLLAGPVVAGRDAFAWSTGWRADAVLLPALMERAAADWSGGASGHVVEAPPGPVLRPEALAEIVGFVQMLTEGGTPVEIELVGAAGSGRATLAAQAAERLGVRLVVVDAAAIAARADAVDAATREARRARLDGSVLAWKHAEALSPTAVASRPRGPADVPVGTRTLGRPRRHRRVYRDPAVDPLRLDHPA